MWGIMWGRMIGAVAFRTSRPFVIRGARKAVKNMSTSLKDTLIKAGVVTDVIDHPPDVQIKLRYGSLEVNPGDILTPTLVGNKPDVSIPSTKDGAFYTLLMTDPDAPSRQDPKWGEWRHWLVVNIPAADFAGGNILSSGEEVAEYIGSGPPEKTGLHRYIFLAFEQSGRLSYTEERLIATTEERANTKARELISKYKLGNPIAANFYLAEYDDFVPKLYKMLDENLQRKK